MSKELLDRKMTDWKLNAEAKSYAEQTYSYALAESDTGQLWDNGVLQGINMSCEKAFRSGAEWMQRRYEVALRKIGMIDKEGNVVAYAYGLADAADAAAVGKNDITNVKADITNVKAAETSAEASGEGGEA